MRTINELLYFVGRKPVMYSQGQLNKYFIKDLAQFCHLLSKTVQSWTYACTCM